ncbi:hypothetical protein ACWCOP_06340 [Maricaulaceae bacterium MS644]
MMLWLTWHMWILLLLAFAGGVITGWVVRSRSDVPERPRLSAGESTPKPGAEPAGTAGAAAASTPAPDEASGPASEAGSPGTAALDDGGDDAPSKAAKASPAPDARSAMAMTAPMQAPGADAGPVTDGPQGETSAGPGAPDPDPGDDLTQIKGLGPKAAEKLNAAGVTRVSEIAGWSSEDVERYDMLINGRGRIERDDWVGQARKMAG